MHQQAMKHTLGNEQEAGCLPEAVTAGAVNSHLQTISDAGSYQANMGTRPSGTHAIVLTRRQVKTAGSESLKKLPHQHIVGRHDMQ